MQRDTHERICNEGKGGGGLKKTIGDALNIILTWPNVGMMMQKRMTRSPWVSRKVIPTENVRSGKGGKIYAQNKLSGFTLTPIADLCMYRVGLKKKLANLFAREAGCSGWGSF